MNFWQIQSIPTVNIYETRPSDPVHRDYGGGMLELVSVVSVLPVSRSAPPDDSAAFLALISCESAGPFNQSGADDGAGLLSLVSCVSIVALSRSVSDPGAAQLALVSVLQLVPTTRTITTETPVSAQIALLSCVV